MKTSEMNCPKCGTECHQDSVDVGVGVIHGPYVAPAAAGPRIWNTIRREAETRSTRRAELSISTAAITLPAQAWLLPIGWLAGWNARSRND